MENGPHWNLDMGLNEDAGRIRTDHAPENFALLRGMAINVIRANTSHTGGVKAKAKLAGWDNEFLLQLLA